MLKGFVFGKFLPFHKGHEAMIDFALTKCDFLTILICCSDKESIPCETRQSWILETYERYENLEVKTFDYCESELPNTSQSSLEVSESWSKKFKALFPDYNLVVTSEEYGKYVSTFLGIEHFAFDMDRLLYPISATTLRKDVFSNWQFLPDSVKGYFAIKVVILGTESTGKTTLTERLSTHFNCTSVSEAGRDIIPDSKLFAFEELYFVASEHAQRIDKACNGQSPLIIIDTDLNITKSYASFMFNRELQVDAAIFNSNKADLYLYLNSDAEYIQDGTRLSLSERDKLDISHRTMLKKNNIAFAEITGNWEQRFEKSVGLISKLIAEMSKKHWT
jgi:HTH-type transcriptional repressor of NAD biosynthesis genes